MYRPPKPRVLVDPSADSLRTATALAIAVSTDGGGGAKLDRAALADLRAFAGADAAALIATGNAVLVRAKAKGRAGEVNTVPLGERLVLLTGVGDGSARDLRRAGASLARRVRGLDSLTVTAIRRADDAGARAFTEGFCLGGYRFRATGASDDAPALPSSIEVAVRDRRRGDARAAVAAGLAVARAGCLSRDLANTPSSTKTPDWLAKRAAAVGKKAGLQVRVRDVRALRAEGFGGILAVGMGSVNPPRLIEMTYAPPGATRHIVLIGKGITFDSGGLSLKPAEPMVPMKTDMTGGGAVIAAMSELAALGVGARVTGLVAAAENMPSGSAQRPSDVITHYGGRTSEVLNTDAEGRLVLADALAYTAAKLDADAVIDLATLTGAASLGLGKRHAALYSADDRLASSLEAAGLSSGELVWRMPLVEDYRPAMDSDIADVANAGRGGFSGGSITAALFLREFTGGLRSWAHLDIAGPARADADEHEVTKGGTGYGARLLLHWLATQQR